MYLITSSQCRAARALLNWSQPELAKKCDVHVQTISAFEQETSTPTKRTLEKIAATLDSAGIEFLANDGVCKKVQHIKTYIGRDGFQEFQWDVYHTVKKAHGAICVSNVKEEWFTINLEKESGDAYLESMAEVHKIKKLDFKILVKHGDTNFTAKNYAEYRWIDDKYFHTVPFYVYGDKLAFLLFQKGPMVHVIENKDIADAQRIQFNVFWESAKIPA